MRKLPPDRCRRTPQQRYGIQTSMAFVTVYSTSYCGYCVRATALLQKRGIPFEKIDVTDDDAKRSWLVQATGGRRTSWASCTSRGSVCFAT